LTSKASTLAADVLIERALAGARLTDAEALALACSGDTGRLSAAARALCEARHGGLVSYSRKVFIPLTHLCRDVCHYCTFARTPRRVGEPYLGIEQVLDIARAGREAGCKEALFTLGDKPELRYRAAREALDRLGAATTLDYLERAARAVFEETGLLPHLNPGVMDREALARLRRVSVSSGLMLESASARLAAPGGPHHGSPDKDPSVRLATLELAGELEVPFTTGILIGIGETRRERIESLLAIRALHERYGHVQEVIVQNFRAKPGTAMARAPEPSVDELVWTIAVARLVLGAEMNIQAPPNLSPGSLERLIDAGVNDWGGVSPITPDHVNPEAPWPHLEALARESERCGKTLVERLAVYPGYALEPERWVDAALRPAVRRFIDASGLAREDAWAPGEAVAPPAVDLSPRTPGRELEVVLGRALEGCRLGVADIVRLFAARGPELGAVCGAADRLRREMKGDRVTYVVNRNINYTNVCYFRCRFCAFSKGRLAESLRGRPYDLDLVEIERRVAEAWARGATEVCLQGGIHPEYTGETYLAVCRAVKRAASGVHVHAFSPLEIRQGARTLGLSLEAFLEALREAGLGSLPGTAAEVLDDEVRARICPDKLTSAEWLEVIERAHEAGLRTTSTLMFGHVERPAHWARHLLALRDLQARSRGITEFVPLPFVPMEAPMYRKGEARRGPTFRETLLVHAVARLVLHPLIDNIQASWVKMGVAGTRAALRAGVNDLGGTLMNESISRAAGASHGQELAPEAMEALVREAGRRPAQRTTLYAEVDEERRLASFGAQPLAEVVNRPARRYERRARELVRFGQGS